MTLLEAFVCVAVIVLVLLPPKYDPTIRWKEMRLGYRKSFFGKADYE